MFVKMETNCLRVNVWRMGKKVVKGSIIYKQNTDEERDKKSMHFYLTTDLLVTIDLELPLLKNINTKNLLRQ